MENPRSWSDRGDLSLATDTAERSESPSRPTAVAELVEAHGETGPPVVDIVVPVYNEEAQLEASVRRLHTYLGRSFPVRWRITVADNASVDSTWAIAEGLATELPNVAAVRLDRKGRGLALNTAWSRSNADVLAYMDVDLSTDLGALLPLVAPLISGHSDLSIGSRLSMASRVDRGPKREAISRIYNLILRFTIRTRFSDAQCGFKAIRGDVARTLLPLVESEKWFFDTEMLAIAEYNAMRIHEVPVDWVDDADSSVDLVQCAREDLEGIWRMLRRFSRGEVELDRSSLRAAPQAPFGSQLVRFASIGLVSTLLFAVLFSAMVGALGPLRADLVALGLCAVANTAANRRLNFAPTAGGSGRRFWYNAAATLVPLVLNLMALGIARVSGVEATWALVTILLAASLVASVIRFALLRSSPATAS